MNNSLNMWILSEVLTKQALALLKKSFSSGPAPRIFRSKYGKNSALSSGGVKKYHNKYYHMKNKQMINMLGLKSTINPK